MQSLLAGTLLLLTVGCTTKPATQPVATAPQIRFLLTFDDGPSIRKGYNPTLAILDQLANNDIQPGIKGLFFVQTEHLKGGGTPRGRGLLLATHQQGHVLGVHSVSAKGHITHTSQPNEELVPEIRQSMEVLKRITGEETRFIRPPFETRNLRTRSVYDQLGLTLLLSNISAHDGIIYGFTGSPRRRSNIYKSLKVLREAAVPENTTYAVVLFHDTNSYTARHMTEYLHILTEEAQRAGFAVPENPFCASREQIALVAEAYQVPPPTYQVSNVRPMD